jgi:hypothetical protein
MNSIEPKRFFCTYFDQGYLPRALAMYHSLVQHCPSFTLWVLCLDDECYETLNKMSLPHIEIISLKDFEHGDKALQQAKQNRSRIEYYFTCTPSLPLFILEHCPFVDLITYLDADLYFFSELDSVYDEIADNSIAIIPHLFTPDMKHREVHGIYNVGWVTFRRDANGLACLQWWRERCLEWCYDRIEPERFADQKYLDKFSIHFNGVISLKHKGANLAPWNLGNYTVLADGLQIKVDEYPLIFYHFHSFKKLNSWLYNTALGDYKVRPSQVIKEEIYAPYIHSLNQISTSIPLRPKVRRSRVWGMEQLRNIKRTIEMLRDILWGRYIFIISGQIF